MTDDLQLPLTQDEKTFGMLAHLSALAVFLFPFGNFIGPLVIWLIKKDQSAWIDRQGKESLNFQISIAIYFIISAILMIVLIGFLLALAVSVFWFVMVIIAAVRVGNGEDFQYPLSIRFLQ